MAKGDTPVRLRWIGALIPATISTLAVSAGAKVARGHRLLTREATKMQITVCAPMASWRRSPPG